MRVHPAGVVGAARRGRHRVRRRGDRRLRPRDGAVRTGDQRGPTADRSRDPRVAAMLDNPLEAVDHEATEHGALLMHQTRASALMMAAAMDHEVEVPGRVEVSADAQRGSGAHHRDLRAAARPDSLRIVKYLAYGWSSLRSRPALRDQVAAAIASARYSGWQGLLDAQRELPRRLLGQRRRRGRRRPRMPAGGAVRPVSRAAGQRARRTPGHPRQGPHRHRLRRPRLLGHRGFRAAGAHLHRARARPPMRCAGGHRRSTWPATRAAELDLRRRRLPVAHHPRRGVLGVLAGRHGGLARQRRHRDGVRALPRCHRRRFAGGGVRSRRCWSRPHGCGCRWDTTTGTASGISTGSPDPTSTPPLVRDNVFTNLMAAHNLRTAAEAC